MRRIVLIAALAALTASLAIAQVGVAAGPTIETDSFTDSFHDDFLSEECGVDVWTTVVGTRISREFVREQGVQVVNTLNVSIVSEAGDNTFRYRDVGADVVQLAPDGSLILLIIGQIPFGWTGVLKIDPETEDVLHEPHWVDTTRACAVLAG